MNKQGLSGAKTSKIFNMFEEINLVGSGVVIYSEQYKDFQQSDAAYMVCSLEEAQRIDVNILSKLVRAIAIKLDQSSISSEAAFQAYYTKKVQHVINQTSLHKKMFKLFLIDWHESMNHFVVKAVLRTLQHMNHFIIIRPNISHANWLKYQTQLYNFTYQVLQIDSLTLSTVSVILKMPELDSSDYSKKLLSIWKRVLPAALGRLIIQNWTNFNQNHPISQLHHIKNMAMTWQLQFLTSDPSRYESLSEHILGLV